MEQQNVYHSGFAAIIGRPNVGKSTLMNHLIGEKVAIVSPRAQTTRNRIMGVLTEPGKQVVFLDTPGLHTPRNLLGESMMRAASEALEGADILLLMMDASDVREQDRALLTKYQELKMPKGLLLNKIDLITREPLARLLDSFREAKMDAVIPISAVKEKGLDRVKSVIFGWLPEGPQYFPEDMITDQPERFIIAEMIREKAMRNLRDEIPHGVGVEILEIAGQGGGMVTIHANLYCEKASHKGIIIGKQGVMLSKIGQLARADIERLLGERVNLQLWIKVREDWRNRKGDLNTLGYE